MKTPSIKKLAEIFGSNAKQAKAILLMSREQLLELPPAIKRVAECYHPPTTQDIRMECLNTLGDFYGVEGFDTKKGECLYLNAGDTYTPTLCRFNGSYRVTAWGDIAEKHA